MLSLFQDLEGAAIAIDPSTDTSAVPNDGYALVGGATGTSRSAATANITVVCHLTGGMGNYLDVYAHCQILTMLLRSQLGVRNARIAVRRKSHKPIKELQKCFPHFRNVDFMEGSHPAYDDALARQRKILIDRFGNASGSTGAAVTESGARAASIAASRFLDGLAQNHFTTYWARHEPSDALQELRAFVDRATEHDAVGAPVVANASGSGAPPAAINPMSVLYARWLFTVDAFIDEFINELRELYTYATSKPNCCKTTPDADETVWVGRGGRGFEMMCFVARHLTSHDRSFSLLFASSAPLRVDILATKTRNPPAPEEFR
jgi:hypothetical protein